MSVQEVLDLKGDRVITAHRKTKLSDIVSILAGEDIGTVMITDDAGKLTGILSERDVLCAIDQHGRSGLDLNATCVMTVSPITCTPDTSVPVVLALMSAHRIRHLPVVEQNRLIGLISVRDVLDFQRRQLIADVERREKETEVLRKALERLDTNPAGNDCALQDA